MELAYSRFVEMVARVKKLPGPTVNTLSMGELSTDDFVGMLLLHAAHHLAFLKLRVGKN